MGWRRGRSSRDEELDEEIRTHLALEAKQKVEAGETPQEAERIARREFGNVAAVMEVTRTLWGYGRLESLAQDLKYAGRGMRRAPLFSIAAILILALGIGSSAIIFRMVDEALLRPLPFAGSDRLVRVWSTKSGTSLGGTFRAGYAGFRRRRRQLRGADRV
jgi:hypothetical protein